MQNSTAPCSPNSHCSKPTPKIPKIAASLLNRPQKPNSSAARLSGANIPTNARPTDWLEPRLSPDNSPEKRKTCSARRARPSQAFNPAVIDSTK